eukprot:scaffold383939_cov32-Prasinocladus_malaysianus.AAC.1
MAARLEVQTALAGLPGRLSDHDSVSVSERASSLTVVVTQSVSKSVSQSGRLQSDPSWMARCFDSITTCKVILQRVGSESISLNLMGTITREKSDLLYCVLFDAQLFLRSLYFC